MRLNCFTLTCTLSLGLLALPLQAAPLRAWGPEQVIGEPNTQGQGDFVTAWASLSEDGQMEWLLLDYARSVVPARLRVFETFNPGAVVKVTALNAQGKETLLWQGQDPLRGNTGNVAELPLDGKQPTRQIKVYLDSAQTPGWNEIDAVELVGRDSSRQWVQQASASSSYAEVNGATCETGTCTQGDTFNLYLGKPLRIQLDNQRVIRGTLKASDALYLTVDDQANQRRLLVPKARILLIAVPYPSR